MSFQMLLARASFSCSRSACCSPFFFISERAGRQLKVAQPKSKPNDHHHTDSLSSIHQRSFYTAYPSFSRPGVHTYKIRRQRESQIQFRVCVCVLGGSSRSSAQIRSGRCDMAHKVHQSSESSRELFGTANLCRHPKLILQTPFPGSSSASIPAGFPTQ